MQTQHRSSCRGNGSTTELEVVNAHIRVAKTRMRPCGVCVGSNQKQLKVNEKTDCTFVKYMKTALNLEIPILNKNLKMRTTNLKKTYFLNLIETLTINKM